MSECRPEAYHRRIRGFPLRIPFRTINYCLKVNNANQALFLDKLPKVSWSKRRVLLEIIAHLDRWILLQSRSYACAKCKTPQWLLFRQAMISDSVSANNPFCDRVPKSQYKDDYRRRIEIPQRTHSFQANCCLKVHNAPLKLPSPISG